MKVTYTGRQALRIVRLEVRSWVGISIGAEHCYGTLKMDYPTDKTKPYSSEEWNERRKRDVEIQRAITTSEAAERNKKEHNESSLFRYKKGDLTTGFFTEADLHEKAIAIWLKHFPDGQALIRGNHGNLDPDIVLDGPPPFVEAANAIVARCVKVDYWEKDEPAMEKLSQEWDDLCASFPFDKWQKKNGVWNESQQGPASANAKRGAIEGVGRKPGRKKSLGGRRKNSKASPRTPC